MDQKFWDKIDSFRQNREYDKIISEIKEEIPEFWDKMDISEEDGEYDKVIREIKNLPADKMDMELIKVLGRAYMYLGDLENALDTCLSFIGKAEEDTLNADIWLYSEAGWTCNELERYEEAIKRLEKSLKLIEADEEENGHDRVDEKLFIYSELGNLYGAYKKKIRRGIR